MDLTGLQTQMNVALGIIAVAFVIGGAFMILKGGNAAKILGIVFGVLGLAAAASIIVNWATIGPAVAGMFT